MGFNLKQPMSGQLEVIFLKKMNHFVKENASSKWKCFGSTDPLVEHIKVFENFEISEIVSVVRFGFVLSFA